MHCRRLLQQMIVVMVAASLLSACGAPAPSVPAAVSPSPQPEAVSSPTSIPSPVPPPTPDPSEVRSAILAAIGHLSDRPYQYEGDTIMADGKTHHTLLAYSPPDRYHIVSDSTSEIIVIGASTGKTVGLKAVSTILYEYDSTIEIVAPIN